MWDDEAVTVIRPLPRSHYPRDSRFVRGAAERVADRYDERIARAYRAEQIDSLLTVAFAVSGLLCGWLAALVSL